MVLPDVQAWKSGFPKIPINKVGIRGLDLLLFVKVKNREVPLVLPVRLSSYCNLTEEVKGINMSRIAQTLSQTVSHLYEQQPNILLVDLFSILVRELQKAHGAEDVYLKAKFKYPIVKETPISRLMAPECVDVIFETILKKDIITELLTVEIVATALCPCSKEMSKLIYNLTPKEKDLLNQIKQKYLFSSEEFPELEEAKTLFQKIEESGFGAHNQKSRIRATVQLTSELFWIEDLVNILSLSASSHAYSLLKRADEKAVTELAYMSKILDDEGKLQDIPGFGPKFVEDIARQAAYSLDQIPNLVADYVVVVENEESIHSGDLSAVAILTAGKNLT